MRNIVLASKSPRRKDLLTNIGMVFSIDPSAYNEQYDHELGPTDLARFHSKKKAEDVARRYNDAIIIGADTLVVLKDSILGKPNTTDEARDMLYLISGNILEVITGFTVIDTNNNKSVTDKEITKVHIKKLSPSEITSYINTGEPLDKAGAFGIQGLGAVLVTKVEGDYYNVVGLPLNKLANILKQFGVALL